MLYIGLLFSSVAKCKCQMHELQHIEPLSVFQPLCRNAAY